MPSPTPTVPTPSSLTGLGVKLVVVIGARPQINQAVRARGGEPRYEHGYRVTDPASMQAAVQAAGLARMEVESRLSKVRCCSAAPRAGRCRIRRLPLPLPQAAMLSKMLPLPLRTPPKSRIATAPAAAGCNGSLWLHS